MCLQQQPTGAALTHSAAMTAARPETLFTPVQLQTPWQRAVQSSAVQWPRGAVRSCSSLRGPPAHTAPPWLLRVPEERGPPHRLCHVAERPLEQQVAAGAGDGEHKGRDGEQAQPHQHAPRKADSLRSSAVNGSMTGACLVSAPSSPLRLCTANRPSG